MSINQENIIFTNAVNKNNLTYRRELDFKETDFNKKYSKQSVEISLNPSCLPVVVDEVKMYFPNKKSDQVLTNEDLRIEKNLYLSEGDKILTSDAYVAEIKKHKNSYVLNLLSEKLKNGDMIYVQHGNYYGNSIVQYNSEKDKIMMRGENSNVSMENINPHVNSVPVYKGKNVFGTHQFSSISSNDKLLNVSDDPETNNIQLNLNVKEIDHNQLKNYNPKEHFPVDDLNTSDKSLWSSSKISRILDNKSSLTHSHNVSEIKNLDEYIRRHPHVSKIFSLEKSVSGSVTNHSDVFDAGSGKIITVQERLDLNNLKNRVDNMKELNSVNIKKAISESNEMVPFTKKELEKIQNLPKDLGPIDVKNLYESNKNTNCLTNKLLDKLENIEENATADLTPKEVKELYEQNPNTNCLTNEDLQKLKDLKGQNTGDEPLATTEVAGVVKLAKRSDLDNNNNNNLVITTEVLKKGKQGGVASLDTNGKLSSQEIPSISHNLLTNKDNDDHQQYLNIRGRKGGQTVFGGKQVNDTLILSGNNNPDNNYGSVVIGGNSPARGNDKGALVVKGGVNVGSNILTETISVRNNAEFGGDIHVDGKINGINLQDLQKNNHAYSERICNLSDNEIAQLENIDNLTITKENWQTLTKLKQNLGPEDVVRFREVDAFITQRKQPQIDHDSLNNLGKDSHPIYVNCNGRDKNQRICGNSHNKEGTLTLKGSAVSTLGSVVIDNTGSNALVSRGDIVTEKNMKVKGNLTVNNPITYKYGSMLSSRTGIYVPSNVECFEIKGDTFDNLLVRQPANAQVGQVLRIHNSTGKTTTGDFVLEPHTGATYFFNGNSWLKC